MLVRLGALVAFVLLAASPAHAQANRALWFSGAVITNPTASQVLLTTAALPGGAYRIATTIYSAPALTTILQHVRAGVVQQAVIIPARQPFTEYIAPLPLPLNAGDTIRVIARVAATAEVQVVIYTQPTS